jgi:hypothetical protein
MVEVQRFLYDHCYAVVIFQTWACIENIIAILRWGFNDNDVGFTPWSDVLLLGYFS